MDDRTLVAALRRRDEASFRLLIAKHHATMVRLVLPYCGDEAVAEEIVQETWAAFLAGLDGFQFRSSLRTWLFGILFNRARSVANREGRTMPLSQLACEVGEGAEDPLDRLFYGDSHPNAGGWSVPPSRWKVNPEDELMSREICRRIQRGSQSLPEAQRVVFILRDTLGWETEEIAKLLGQTRNWVRVVLHRARLKLREELEDFLGGA
jgi:RNA polymerase sigma-70 factor (ECF subfamily)